MKSAPRSNDSWSLRNKWRGLCAWIKGQAAWGSQRLQPVAAGGAWTSDDTFTAKLAFYETPFVYTVSLKFAGDELRYTNESNVAFGPAREPDLVGKPAPAENKQ